MDNYEKVLQELNIQDFISVVFIILSLLNIYGDSHEKKYIKNNDYYEKQKADYIFELTIIISLIIYFYFLSRNYEALKEAPTDKKELYQIKLLGSILFIVGGLCLLYFQEKQKSFIGIPEL